MDCLNPTCIGPSLPHTQALMSGDTSTTYSMGNTPSHDSMDVVSSTNSNAIDVPENTPSTQNTCSFSLYTNHSSITDSFN